MPTTAPVAVADLEAERAQVLDQIDDILNTAREDAERALTDDERTEHDGLVERSESLTEDIRSARLADADAGRYAAQEARRSTPNVNRITDPPATAERSLDEILWATNETVRAGTAGEQGFFQANPYGAVNPVDQVIVRSDAHDIGLPAPRLTEFTPDSRGLVRSFQALVEDMCVFGLMIDKDARSSSHGFHAARSHRLFRDRWTNVCRAMDVDTSAEGGTWVPTGIGASMHEKVRAMGKIAPLFNRINLPTNPWKWPLEGADVTAYRVAEPTGDTESKMTAGTPGTGAATFDAEIFGGRVLFSRSLEADSALAIMPYVQYKLAKAFSIAEERAILDGDTDGTHQDSDVGASTTDARTAWDGLRKKGLTDTSSSQTSTTAAKLALARKDMGKWGVNPMDCVFILGVQSYHALLADTSLLTVDKFGPSATILNGQIGSVHGVPVVISEYVREDINASGVYDGITTTKTYFLCVNRNEWAMGQRMALDVAVDDSIYRETFQRVVVAFMREDFQSITDTAANDTTSIGYATVSGT